MNIVILDELKRQWEVGNRHALSKALTWAEENWLDALTHLSENSMPLFLIGVTGPPGCGKSTLIGHLTKQIRLQTKEFIGILAIDPTSIKSGGAFLGDRVRMQDLTDDNRVFIRSLSNKARPGGISLHAWAMAEVLKFLGFTLVFIETVGIGQSEVEISSIADLTLLVLSPEFGDSIQLLKGGMLEVADAVVINKQDIDLKRANMMLHELPHMVGRNVPVFLTTALNGDGVNEVIDYLTKERIKNPHTSTHQIAQQLKLLIDNIVSDQWCKQPLKEKWFKFAESVSMQQCSRSEAIKSLLSTLASQLVK